MTHRDEFDSLLDEALRAYGNSEPLAGLENRVLQRLQLQRERRQKLWLRWCAAVASAAVIAMALCFGVRKPTYPTGLSHVETVQRSSQTTPQPPPNRQLAEDKSRLRPTKPNLRAEAAAPYSPNRSRRSAVAPPVAALPPSQFPTPAPLSFEEHALLVVAQLHPEVLLKLGENPQDLSITNIQIKPLQERQADAEGDSR